MRLHLVKSPIAYVSKLHLKVHDHTKSFIMNFPRYDLLMSFKGPCTFMVMIFGHSIKRALGVGVTKHWSTFSYFQQCGVEIRLDS